MPLPLPQAAKACKPKILGQHHGGGTFADADGEDGVDAGGVGSAKDFVEVVGGFGVEVEVGVGVG